MTKNGIKDVNQYAVVVEWSNDKTTYTSRSEFMNARERDAFIENLKSFGTEARVLKMEELKID